MKGRWRLGLSNFFSSPKSIGEHPTQCASLAWDNEMLREFSTPRIADLEEESKVVGAVFRAPYPRGGGHIEKRADTSKEIAWCFVPRHLCDLER
jgi:hypothetical protein